ncbi:MAG: SET domain-containing protein-lysine N-methyltransferase [Sphingomonadales bacterium]
MLLPCLYIAPTRAKGRGVFTSEPLEAGQLIECSPVIVLNANDRKLLDQTLLHDYIFEWDPEQKQCCMALGYVPLYNHACPSNCEYEMDYDAGQISIRTLRGIQKGEELLINYHGDFDKADPLWFTTH